MTLDEHNYFQMHRKEDYGTNLKTVFHDLSLQTKNEKEDFSDALSSNVNSRTFQFLQKKCRHGRVFQCLCEDTKMIKTSIPKIVP